MEKIIKEGKVGVIIHEGWGSGWSTDKGMPKSSLFDPTLIQMLEKQSTQKQIEEYALSTYGKKSWGGWSGHNLVILWVEEGREFLITEYDGMESIFFKDSAPWIFP